MPRDYRARRDADVALPPAPEPDDGERECARGQWCSALTIRRNADGTVEWVPARSPRPFCDPCAAGVSHAIDGLPAAWAMLRLWGLEPGASGGRVRSPAGPRLPLAAAADALMRAIPEALLSWEERVHDVAGLSDLDRHRHRRQVLRSGELPGDPEAVQRFLVPLRATARLLREYQTTLLSLEAASMGRPTGDGVEFRDMDGTDAGHEFLRLRHQARAHVGLVTGRPDYFEGVPCKQCGAMELERAPLPSRPGDEAMWSRCGNCAALMTEAQYGAWADWYAGWAKSAGLACRKCQLGRHTECAWERCDCRVQGHLGGQRAPA